MKKLILIIEVFIAAMIFNSCSSNDSDTQITDKIVGKWRLNQLIIDNVDMQINECEKKMTLEILDNGTYIEKDYEYNETATECMLYDMISGIWKNMGSSNYKISGLNTEYVKVTFEGSKIIAEYIEENNEISYAIKAIFIDDNEVVTDKIIGKWSQAQEFLDGEEIALSECEKKGTIEFFEDGIFQELDFYDDKANTGCIAIPLKTGLWKNVGNSMYKLTNINIENEIKITFESDKMIIELSIEEEGIIHQLKLIFINVSS